jgi:hypothetical protein
MYETMPSMNRYVPRYNPFTGESINIPRYNPLIGASYSDDAMGYFESWRQAMMDHYRGLGLLEEPEEEIDFSAPEWNNLVLN